MHLLLSPFSEKRETARECQGWLKSRVSVPAAKFPSEREMAWRGFGEACRALQGLSDAVPFLGNTEYLLFLYIYIYNYTLFNARTPIVSG